MCGIAGIIRIHDPKDGAPPPPLEAIPEAWLDILDESIKHRGPDGQGRFRDRAVRDDGTIVDVALVHRRLSIIDHEGGHQPMVHDGSRLREDLTYQPGDTPIIASEVEPDLPLVAVVFNGCIYNHRELREELEAKGHVFETDHSDTEVLVHGWREWSSKLTDRMDSMHAAAIWKRERAEFELSRDLIGQKPLYAFEVSTNLKSHIFSSEPSTIRHLVKTVYPRGNKIDIGYDILTCDMDIWLRFGWGYDMQAYDGKEIANNETAKLLTYEACDFNPPVPEAMYIRSMLEPCNELCSDDLPERGSFELTVETTDSLIQNAVTSCTDADVPMSLLLSGGVDSGLLAGVSAKLGIDITAVTVRMPDPRYDESEAATEIAKHTGLKHQIIDCDPEPADDLTRLIHQLGLPFADSSLLPTYWACKAASEVSKVAIGGDGGDELFAGYSRHTVSCNNLSLKFAALILPWKALPSRDPKSASSKLGRLLRASMHLGYPELLSIYDTEMLTELMGGPKGMGANLFDSGSIDLPAYDFLYYLPQDLLRKADTASMAMPIELRAPLLSRSITTACLATSLDVLMPKGQRKGLLKQVARKYLPDHIVDRPKQGFAIPIGEWFRTDYGSMRTLLYDHLESADPFPGLAEAGVAINMDFVRKMLSQHDAAGEKSINPWHGRDHSQRLYMLLVLSIWSKWLASIR
jgi:asparagine synthase (glutamine-hydrolysing)